MTGGAYQQDPNDGMGGYPPQNGSHGSMHGGSHQDINRHGEWRHLANKVVQKATTNGNLFKFKCLFILLIVIKSD